MRLHTVAETPRGDEVQGSGGIRKVRVAGRGKGKSGGYRVMVAFLGDEISTDLLALLSKGDRGNVTSREIAGMQTLTAALKLAWRDRRRGR